MYTSILTTNQPKATPAAAAPAESSSSSSSSKTFAIEFSNKETIDIPYDANASFAQAAADLCSKHGYKLEECTVKYAFYLIAVVDGLMTID